ncbi:DUF2834 domain-containing protein [Pseudoalteromonas umbrosa]|uniref:DUF2834 domain-containing protein n=1 Tax=Pseudoalteromonas umbrosa TaxID=3048489 RepID=UPI0024C25E72|nr:DUF2834 domain-containing protein [Pseudoalteromonas sp. B95]MDK1286235.1 DUF2834 domain-containing protein [Pseudoalteromonas sp. B95]
MKYVYGLLCILGILAPFSAFAPWLFLHGLDLIRLYEEVNADPLASFAWLDVIVSAIVLIIFILYEGKKLGVRYLWLPIVSTMMVGVSFGLPLFLLMRELHAEKERAHS